MAIADYHTTSPFPRKPVIDRLMAKVSPEPNSGCWLWEGAVDPRTGYARITIETGRVENAHRSSYQLHVGPVPDGLQLDHLCRVRSCVNPDHLEPVTCAETLRRGAGPVKTKALKAAQTHCKRGHLLSGDNVTHDKGNSARICIECRRLRGREKYYRAKGRA